jgi:hypothetical protein
MAFVGGQASLDKSGDLPRRPKWRFHRGATLFDELAACRTLPPHGYKDNRTGRFDIHLIDGQDT